MDTTVLSEKDRVSIQKLYVKSPLHKRSLAEMAEMGRIRDTTDINRFRLRVVKLGFQCTLADVANVFKDLEKAGFGKLIVGSYMNSKPYRFEWKKSNIVAVGKEATKDEEPEKMPTIFQNQQGGTVATTGGGRMLCMYSTPSGERIRLSFNTKAEVQDLIHLLEEMVRA